MPRARPRFVVLRHEFGPGEQGSDHWDLMFEQGDVLATWRFEEAWPPSAVSRAEKIQAHRLEYLDYEGPLSGRRGSVRRVDRGTYAIVNETTKQLIVDIAGASLRGRIALTRRDSREDQGRSLFQDQWDVSFVANDACVGPPSSDGGSNESSGT